MKHFLKILLVFFVAVQVNGQEINARITIISDNIPGSNKQVFQTLERDLNDYINQKKWTNRNFLPQEKIDCAFTITLQEQLASNEFKGNIQVQSVRPVYNSTYLSSIFNFRDTDFSFRYTEFENFEYNPNGFDSNLIQVVAFYVYTILGIDADSFQLNGGNPYYDQAENAMNQAQQSGYKGWGANDSGITRYKLITDILSPTFTGFRNAMFTYHFEGLDIMFDDKKLAKENVDKAIRQLKVIYDRRPTAPLVRVFMDAKAEEIVNIYSGGPRYETDDLKEVLSRISAVNISKWNEIE
ncbi:MAG: DUF4835 family protein [Urechidicola sp.]|nr:DUF4835 family protein [Urechidicola sp.]